jgi:hypothetical protein
MAEEKKEIDELVLADAKYAIAKNFLNFEPLGPIKYDLPLRSLRSESR